MNKQAKDLQAAEKQRKTSCTPFRFFQLAKNVSVASLEKYSIILNRKSALFHASLELFSKVNAIFPQQYLRVEKNNVDLYTNSIRKSIQETNFAIFKRFQN